MLVTAFFAFHLLIFLGILNSEKLFLSLPSARRPRLSGGSVFLGGMPWLILVTGAVYWAFVVDPTPLDYVQFLRIPENGYFALWLIVIILVSLPLSYVVVFKVGSKRGYREGQTQSRLALSPILLATGQVGVYRFPSDILKEGDEIFCAGQNYIVRAIRPEEELLFVVANCKEQQPEPPTTSGDNRAPITIQEFNQHPLNQAALERLRKEGLPADPKVPYLLQLGYGEEVDEDSIRLAALSQRSPKTAFHQVAEESELTPEKVLSLPLNQLQEEINHALRP